MKFSSTLPGRLYKSALALALCAALPAFAADNSYQLRVKVEGLVATAPTSQAHFTVSTPATGSFPDTVVNKTAGPIRYGVRNDGAAVGSLPTPTVGGANAGDFTAVSSCANVAPGGACEVAVSFKPTQEGIRSASLSLAGSAYPLQGRALPEPIPMAQFSVTSVPSTMFASTRVGTQASATLTYVVRNGGTAVGSMPVLTMSGTNPGDFAVTSTCSNVAIGANCAVTVSFTPTAAGTRSASLVLLGTAYDVQGVGAAEPMGDGVSRTGACAAGSGACALFDRSRGYETNITGFTDGDRTIYRMQPSSPNIYLTKVPTSGKSYFEVKATNSPYTSYFYCGSKYVGLNYSSSATYRFMLDYDTRTVKVYQPSGVIATWTGVTSMDCFFQLYSRIEGNFGQYDFQYAVPAGYRPGIY